jgi:GAF domain-containing protein
MTSKSSDEDGLSAGLERLIQSLEVSGRAVLPATNQALLQSIVEAAARIFGAVAAAIALLSEDGQFLEFKVAYNTIHQNIIGMRFPSGQGIAGYVAMTGQPLAVANVADDARFNSGFAQQSGYVPKTILAVPLASDGHIIGVMEALDKTSGESFTIQDMELLSIFAGQAAMAIHQSQQIDNLQVELLAGLKRLLQPEDDALIEALEAVEPSGPELLQLAERIYAISALGQAERTACLRILNAFYDLSKAKSQRSFRKTS